MPDIALIIALIISAAMFCQWLAWPMQLPAILFLLLAGILAGPFTGLLIPDALFTIDNKKRVKPFVAGRPLKPLSGWKIISLCPLSGINA